MKLTQEQLAELITRVLDGVTAKRKALEEAGEHLGDAISTDEILSEIGTILEEDTEADNVTPEEPAVEKHDEKEQEAPEMTPEFVAKVIDALNKIKESAEPEAASLTGCVETEGWAGPSLKGKRSNAPVQRKYADLFFTKSTGRTAAGESGFKERVAGMSAVDKKKNVFGMFGRAVKCIHASGGDVEKAAYTAEHKFRDAEMAREFKALSASSPADGGYLVPEVYANEIIELLYPATVIYALGARRLGMANGNLNIPKIKTGSRALFTGESRAIPKTAPKFGNLKLSAKKLTALIPMSNDLLRSTNFDNDVIVGQDITRQMALGVDYGAILGSGGEFQPLGIVKNKNVQSIDCTGLDAEYANSGVLTAAFPNYLVAAVLKNNAYADGLGFVFNTSVEQFFKSLRDNVGGFIFAEEMGKNGTLAGYPYRTTNLLETKNGQTQIIFGNWNDLIIGEQGALEIETSREGSWTDDAGNLISAFENDQTLIRAINNVDAGLRHEESFVVATKVSVPV